MTTTTKSKGKTSAEHYTTLLTQIDLLKELNIIGEGGGAEADVLESKSKDGEHKYQLVHKDIDSPRKLPLVPEELARTVILHDLRKNYRPSLISLEKEYKLGRVNSKPKRLDISLNYPTDDAFALIEVKQYTEFDHETDDDIEGQLFNIASIQQSTQTEPIKYLVYASAKIDITNKTAVHEYVVIDYLSYQSFDGWVKAGRPYTKSLPANYASNGQCNIKCGDTLKELDSKEITKLRQRINNRLYAGGGIPDNLVFATIVNAFLAKIHDEETCKLGDDYRFQYVYTESVEVFMERMNTLYRDALEDKLDIEIHKGEESKYNITDSTKVKPEQLAFLVESLQRFNISRSITNASYDVLGDFFESISRDQFKQTKGQFFTHQKIVDFIISMCDLKNLCDKTINENRLPYSADLSSGSGTFLISIMKQISNYLKERKTKTNTKKIQGLIENDWSLEQQPNKWAKDYIYGTEKDVDLGTAIKVNMILHGDGKAHIGVGRNNGDGLVSLDRFKENLKVQEAIVSAPGYSKKVMPFLDLIVSNPPFSVTLDGETKGEVTKCYELNSTSDSEVLFLERYYQTLRPQGRVGIVLPESVFDGDGLLSTRMFLVKYFKIRAIVSLPISAFAPYATVKTSVVFLEKRINPLYKIDMLGLDIKDLKEAKKSLLDKKLSPDSLAAEIKYIDDLIEAKSESIFYYQAENVGYKRRTNKDDIIFEKSDLNDLLANIQNSGLNIWENTIQINDDRAMYIKLSKVVRERTWRLDAAYNMVFNSDDFECSGQRLLDYLAPVPLDKYTTVNGKALMQNALTDPTGVHYAEIGNINSYGEVISTSDINCDADKDNIASVVKKISSGDYFAGNDGDILISSVRPYLGKHVLVEDGMKNMYFTKALLPFSVKSKSNKLSIYHLIKVILRNEIAAVSRIGKGYPCINTQDILDLQLSKQNAEALKMLTKNQVSLRNAYAQVSQQQRKLLELKAQLANFNGEDELEEKVHDAF